MQVQDQSIAQMLRRFYKNDAITWEKFYWPIIEQLLDRLDLEVYYLVADTTSVGQDHRALVLSLAYHKRSLPLIWHIEPGIKGHTSEDLQVELGAVALIYHGRFVKIILNFLINSTQMGKEIQPL